MYIHVNGEEFDVKAYFLADLLDELGFEGTWVATAVNSEVVADDKRANHRIYENDKIEVLRPMQGG